MEPQLAPGRSCEGCTLCCTLLRIPELNKPRLETCRHCDVGRGCQIYESRPSGCRTYYCDYRRSAALPEIWRPVDSHMIMSFDPQSLRVDVQVDPAHPGAWKKQPFYAQIKAIAINALRSKGHLIVWEGREAIAVLPDRDVSLGEVARDFIVITSNDTPSGVVYDAHLMAADDPRREETPSV